MIESGLPIQFSPSGNYRRTLISTYLGPSMYATEARHTPHYIPVDSLHVSSKDELLQSRIALEKRSQIILSP